MLYFGLNRAFFVSLVFLFSTWAQATGVLESSSTPKSERVIFSAGASSSQPREWSIRMGKRGSEAQQAEIAQAFGFHFQWDQERKILKILSIDPVRCKPVPLRIETTLPVELEGESQHPITVVSPGGQVVGRWSSPRLTFTPSGGSSLESPCFQIDPSGVLEVQSLIQPSGKWLNRGKILSSRELEIEVGSGEFQNFGTIESQQVLRFIDRRNTAHFENFGKVVAPEIEAGDLLAPFHTFKNAGSRKGVIHAKRFFAEADHFFNFGEIHASEKVFLAGYELDNQQGSLHSGGNLRAEFAQVLNRGGSLSGRLKTELEVRQSLDNEAGEIGSVSGTNLIFHPGIEGKVQVEHLGKIQGTEIVLSASQKEPFSLQTGELYGQKSISVHSESKILLPGVEVHTPVLNLSVPDFALDEQKECGQTFVHCDPSRNFSLTSPYCTQGGVTFLQSCFKPTSSWGQSSTALSETSQGFLKQQAVALKEKVDQMAVYFERAAGRASQFKVELRADLKSQKEVQFIAPLANIYLGDSKEGSEVGIEAKSFRAWANFLFVLDGSMAAQDALVCAPGGLRVGRLVEHPLDRVQVGGSSFPLLCRNQGLWTTQNQTVVKGPLNCDGTMEIGGDLRVQSEKDQWSFSPEIRVQGDLVFGGSGDFNVLRHWGEIRHEGDTRSSSQYSVPGRVRVEKSVRAEKPLALKLYATSFYADEIEGNVSFQLVDSTGNQEIQFPGEVPQRHFRSSLSGRKIGVVQLKGKNNQGVIFSPQLFLMEQEGQFYLATKNPYYFDPKNPIQDLMKKGFQLNTTYLTPDLKKVMERAGEFRFHYSLKERFFFNPSKSERFYDQVKDHIVVYEAGKGLSSLPPGQAVFSLSPQVLLKQVQDSCQDTLMRGYVYQDQPITLDFLADLHRNATEYLASLGISFSAKNQSWAVGESVMVALKNPTSSHRLPEKALIFYQRFVNEQGVEELKPYFYLPPQLLREAREEQTGNVFAKILGRFPEGTTAEEMVSLLPPESGVRKALEEFFENNPQTKRAITQAAIRCRLKEAERGSSEEDRVSLSIPIRAAHFALMTEDDLEIKTNLRGKSGAFVSKNGSVAVESRKTRQRREGGQYEDHLSEERELTYEGHLEFRAGKDIRTTAVKVTAGSLGLEAKGDVIDSALLLDSYEEKGLFWKKETKGQRKVQVSRFNVKEGMTVRGNDVFLEGTHLDAENLHLKAQGKIDLLGVKEFQESTTPDPFFFSGRKQEEFRSQYVPTQLRAKTIEMEAGKDIRTTAVDVTADSLEMTAGENILDSAVLLYSSEKRETLRTQEEWSQKKAQVSRFKVKEGMILTGGGSLVLQGTQADSKNTVLKAPRGKVAILGVNEESQYSKTTEEETGALFWAGTKTETHLESDSQFRPAKVEGRILEVEGKEIILQAPHLKVEETSLKADTVKITLGKNVSSTSFVEKSENPFWISLKSYQQQDETHTQLQTEGTLKIETKTLELEQVEGQVLHYLDHLEYDPAQVKVIQTLLEELHHREEKSISAPGPALIAAVAVAMTLATGGAGSAVVTSIGLKAVSGLASSMVGAAVSSLAAQVATQVTLAALSGQNLGDLIKSLAGAQTLKAVVTSSLTGGALYGVQGVPGETLLLQKAKLAGTQSVVGLGTDLAFQEKEFSEALRGAGVQFVSQGLGSYIADQIGHYYRDQTDLSSRWMHKVAHGVSAGALGAGGAALTGGDVGLAATASAGGAMTAEIVADILSAPLKEDVLEEIKKKQVEAGRLLTQDEVKAIWDAKVGEVTKIAKLSGAISGLLTGQAEGVNRASSSSSTVIENNSLETMAFRWETVAPILMELAEVSGFVVPVVGVGVGVGVLGYGLYQAAQHGDFSLADQGGEKTTGFNPVVFDFGLPGFPSGDSLEMGTQTVPVSLGDTSTQTEVSGVRLPTGVLRLSTKEGKIGDSAGGEAAKPVFEPNPKHGPVQKGRANPAPTNPQETLDNSVRVSENSSRRVGADKTTGEFDVFDEHTAGKFHGHQRTWGELTEAMKSALIKGKITNHKGKIL